MAEEFEVDDDLPIDRCEQIPCPFCDLRPSLPPDPRPEQSHTPTDDTDPSHSGESPAPSEVQDSRRSD